MNDISIGYWLADTAGVGSIFVLVVGVTVFISYVAMLRWVQTAPPVQPVTAAKPAEGEEAAGGAAA